MILGNQMHSWCGAQTSEMGSVFFQTRWQVNAGRGCHRGASKLRRCKPAQTKTSHGRPRDVIVTFDDQSERCPNKHINVPSVASSTTGHDARSLSAKAIRAAASGFSTSSVPVGKCHRVHHCGSLADAVIRAKPHKPFRRMTARCWASGDEASSC